MPLIPGTTAMAKGFNVAWVGAAWLCSFGAIPQLNRWLHGSKLLFDASPLQFGSFIHFIPLFTTVLQHFRLEDGELAVVLKHDSSIILHL